MANSYLSPNMNLVVPVPTVDPGPDWSYNLNASLTILDQHSHTAGSGVLITPPAMNINTDLTFNSHNATVLRSVRFNPNVAALSVPSDLGCLYEAGVDLYYNDGSGNQIRITQSGSVTGSPGTITGLPSGTASASFAAGVFTFQASTNTPANIDGGSFVFRNNVINSKGLTLSPPNAMGADYSITLPILPGATSFVTIDTSGNMGDSIPVTNGLTGSNLVPNIDLPLYPTANTHRIVVSNTNASAYAIGVIRAHFSAVGTLLAGEGVSAVQVGTGQYNLTWDSPFADLPVAVVSSESNRIAGIQATATTPTGTTVLVTTNAGGSSDNSFSIIVMGQRN